MIQQEKEKTAPGNGRLPQVKWVEEGRRKESPFGYTLGQCNNEFVNGRFEVH